MPPKLILRGLKDAAVDPDRREVYFALSVKNGPSPDFVGDAGVVRQIAGALGRMAFELRLPGPEATAAEKVDRYTVQRDPLSEVVILRMMTPEGIPYTFGIPLIAAADIAERLKTESAKAKPVGNA